MFKENLKKLRKNRGLNQVDLADKLGISDKTISSWESGRTEPNMKQLNELSKIFNVSINVLVGKDEFVKNTYGNHEANLEYFADKPEVLEMYKEIYENENLALLFDTARELKPEELEKVLKYMKLVLDEEL